MSRKSTSGSTSQPPQGAPLVFDPVRTRLRLMEWFPVLTPKEAERFITYLTELNKFNKAVNLVSPSTLPVADAVHLADSIYAQRLIVRALNVGAPVYDLGSGNGFPGLVLGMMNPSINVILVDRDERKLEFCKHVASMTGAENVTTLKKDVAALPDKSISNAIARGLAPLARSLLLTRPKIPKGGKFFHLKGERWATELSQVPSQLFSRWQPSLIGTYRLPDLGAEMAVVLTDKIAD